ncbi:SURF1 family protein [Xenophilus azovorans]|uniref:SURF1 family protein n=1 Tax=Xenophilus azovorans TaxID=151755 RepID=UPI000A4FE48A
MRAAPTGPAAASRGRRAALLAGVAVGIAGFVLLGNWQVQRLAWKRDLIARVDARIHAPPVAAPGPAEWPAIDRTRHEYLRVQADGRYLHDKEALVQASTALGAGYWVLTPLATADGHRIWINRGFVPTEARDPARRGRPAPEGTVHVQGLLRLSEPGGAFLRDNDPAAQRWHSRDVAALSAAHGLPAGSVAPYFIDAQAEPGTPAGTWPAAGLTVVRFSNSHLVYAITWYGLAALLLGATVYLLRSERRHGQ